MSFYMTQPPADELPATLPDGVKCECGDTLSNIRLVGGVYQCDSEGSGGNYKNTIAKADHVNWETVPKPADDKPRVPVVGDYCEGDSLNGEPHAGYLVADRHLASPDESLLRPTPYAVSDGWFVMTKTLRRVSEPSAPPAVEKELPCCNCGAMVTKATDAASPGWMPLCRPCKSTLVNVNDPFTVICGDCGQPIKSALESCARTRMENGRRVPVPGQFHSKCPPADPYKKAEEASPRWMADQNARHRAALEKHKADFDRSTREREAALNRNERHWPAAWSSPSWDGET